MICPMLRLEATRCRSVGTTACTQVRGLGMDTVSPSLCTIHPAWSILGRPASITLLARTLVVPQFLGATSAAWRYLLVISTINPNITLRSNLTSHTCSGCRERTRKVRRPRWGHFSVCRGGVGVRTFLVGKTVTQCAPQAQANSWFCRAVLPLTCV